MSKFKKISEKNKKTQRFAVWKMWFGVFISRFFPDRGSIPEDIGNNVLMSNNMYITKNAITRLVLITDLGLTCPIAFTSKLIPQVKASAANATVDYIIKGSKYAPNTSGGGLTSRVDQWNRTINNPEASEKSQVTAARLKYSADVISSNTFVEKGRFYIRVRAENGSRVAVALDAVCKYLDSQDVDYKVINDDMETHVKYSSMISNQTSPRMADIPYLILSSRVLSEILPNSQGLNDSSGVLLGINEMNMQPYLLDYKSSSTAKNILLSALSGIGKTFLCISWLFDFAAQNTNICIADLKGEFRSFVNGRGGIIIPMHASSTFYVNTFRFPDKTTEDPAGYFNFRVMESKKRLQLIFNLPENLSNRGDEIIEYLMDGLYNDLGVIRDNPNTWYRADSLTPYAVFDYFESTVLGSLSSSYSDIMSQVYASLRMYYSKSGIASTCFKDEIILEDIVDAKALSFDFGMTKNSRLPDEILFKLRLRDMELIDTEYTLEKKRRKEWTVFVGEESQIAPEYLIEIYSRKVTLGRAQNLINIILGNSVRALASSKAAEALLDNINIYVIGLVHKSSREYLVEEFGLDKYIKELEEMSDTSLENTFLLVNKMQKKGAPARLKAYVPKEVATSEIFKNVDVE